MRHFIAILAIFVICIAPVKSQQFRVGLLAGVNMTAVDGIDPVDADNDFRKFGPTAGIYVTTHVGERTFLQMEIAYAQKGSSLPPQVDTSTTPSSNPNPNQGNVNNNGYYTLRLNYINVDLLVRHNVHINLSKSPTDKFSIEGGASLGYMFRYFYSVQSIEYTLPVRSSDISAFAGFTYNFSDNFCIDFRYYNSVLSIFPSEANNSQWLYYSSWNRGHNLCFQITFKYTFGGGAAAQPVTPTEAQPNN